MAIKRIDESTKIKSGDVTITVTADPLELDDDMGKALAGPSNAAARAIAAGIRSCAVPASPATIRRRKAQGIHSTQKWHATGRLANSVRAERSGDSYEIAVDGDRLQDERMLAEFERDVPVVQDPVTDEVEREFEKSVDNMLQVRPRVR